VSLFNMSIWCESVLCCSPPERARKRSRDVETLGVLRLTVSRASRQRILHTPDSVVKCGNRRAPGFFAHALGHLLQVGRAHDLMAIKDR